MEYTFYGIYLKYVLWYVGHQEIRTGHFDHKKTNSMRFLFMPENT